MVAAWIAASIVALGVVGALVAVYFTLVRYRLIRPDAPWVPSFCRMDEDTCATVVDSDHGHLFGPPNSVLGLAWYGAATGAGAAGLVTGQIPLCATLILIAVVSVAVSLYLAYALVRILETHCRLCYTSHLLNGALLVTLAAGCI